MSVQQGAENNPVPISEGYDVPPAHVWARWPDELKKLYIKDVEAERKQRRKDAAHRRLMDKMPHISTVLVTR